MKREYDLVVIGAGAAGMLCAGTAAEEGLSVLLLEKNHKVGRKLLITGKGRCNVTNNCDEDSFLKVVRRNPRFLYSAINRFSTADTMAFFEGLGVPLKTERGNRVFPVSDRAADIVDALHRYVKRSGAELREGEAKELLLDETGVRGVICKDGSEIYARRVAVATGGVSYPSTGSTGDGYLFAKENGLNVTRLSASLVGLTMDEKWPTLLQGLSLKNVRITAKVGKKTIYSELGEMLFTHFGVSGPLMIELSSHAPEDFSQMAVTLDMKPGLTEEQIDLRLQRDFAENIRKQLSSVLTGLMPARMAPVFAKLCGVDADTPINQVTREQRLAIGRELKALPLRVVGTRPIEEAIVTRGGVDVLEITPGTMMSKKTPGLFFAGEVLDVDAHTGGFNLQIAFSTGALAGKSAAAWSMER